MPSLEFEVFCSRCGDGLCRNATVKGTKVYIEPCERCLERAKEEGDSTGYDRGWDKGHEDGMKDGTEH